MSTTELAKRPVARTATPASAARGRPGITPRPLYGHLALAVAGLGVGLVVATVVEGESGGALASAGGWLIALGRFGGFTSAYVLLLMLLLIARIPPLERSIGQDRLVHWHRRLAPIAMGLITAHVVLITLGYAEQARTGPLAQLWSFITNYPDLLAAIVAFALLMMASVTSVRIARRRLRYETWWVVHLYTYVALALAFAHQIIDGGDFVGHPLTRLVWCLAWGATAGVVLSFRVLLPIIRNARHRVRAVAVREEVPGVYSVVCSGQGLERLAISGGQFFQWRFMAKGLWWHSHPYSLSALPRPPLMRLTVKAIGDQSSAVANLKPGTRVLLEGPYGSFTTHARRSDRVALFAAGVGVTPLRALLEDLPPSVDSAVVLRASSVEQLIHRREIATLVAERGGSLHEVVGLRSTVEFDAKHIAAMVPDLARRDVYVCGPEGFSEHVVSVARRFGVPSERIHRETFSF